MPLVKQTSLGKKYLKKEIAQSDFGAVTATHLYDKQLGSNGVNNTTFTLPGNFAIGSNTLLVFVNGTKAILKAPPTTASEYEEVSSRIIRFGAALNASDVVEFVVAGTWDMDESASNFYSTLNPVKITSNYTADHLDRVLVDSRVGSLQVTLPNLPSENTVIEIIDAGGQAGTNNITINRNGQFIEGLPDNLIVNFTGLHVFLVYIDASYGWKYTVGFNTKVVPLAEDSNNLGGIPASSYATVAWVTLQNFATQTWVTGRGYATETWVDANYVNKSTPIGGNGMLCFAYEGIAQVDDNIVSGIFFDDDVTISSITVNARIPPTGDDIQIDLYLDGVKQATPALLTDGNSFQKSTINQACTTAQRAELRIFSVGSMEPGQGLNVIVNYAVT